MKQESSGFIEVCLRLINSNLRHFWLCFSIVVIPTLVVFALVMWVIEPTYRSKAIVTPPSASKTSLQGLGSLLGGSSGGLSSLLGFSFSDNDANAVWTILNSWELHNMVIEKFNLAEHYEFDGKFHADLLKEFRKNFSLDCNKESMFEVSIEDKDYKMAAAMVQFMLDKADSAFNAFKTMQAKQSREYMMSRLDSCERTLDSLLQGFTKFQVEHDFYDPEIQLESTIKYLGELQSHREEIGMELAFEKADRGENSKRYDELSKRYKSVNAALSGALNGKQKSVGVVSLKQSPELGKEYTMWKAQIKIQEALYKILRQQSEELRMEESKMLTNLHVLEAPWENDKKVAPLRGVTLIFTVFVSFLIATIVANLLDYLKEEETRGSSVAAQWNTFKGFFKKQKA